MPRRSMRSARTRTGSAQNAARARAVNPSERRPLRYALAALAWDSIVSPDLGNTGTPGGGVLNLSGWRHALRARRSRRCNSRVWEFPPDRSAATDHALGPNAAAVTFDEVLHDRQS